MRPVTEYTFESIITGKTDAAAKTAAFKNKLLFRNGINSDKLPSWQKRGIGVY